MKRNGCARLNRTYLVVPSSPASWVAIESLLRSTVLCLACKAIVYIGEHSRKFLRGDVINFLESCEVL